MGCWEWFALITGIIGMVAFLMAIPSLFHIWGKPEIRVFFVCTQGCKLICWIRNMPVNRILLSLNVVRRQVEISPMVTIMDEGGKIKHFTHYATTSSDDIRLAIAEVKSSKDGKLPLKAQEGKVFLKDQDDQYTYQVLEAGLYKLVLELWRDGREPQRKEKRFRVNQNYPFVEWVNNK